MLNYKQQLKELCSKKEIDSSETYHFYFVETTDNKTYEDRDEKVPMSGCFNDLTFKV